MAKRKNMKADKPMFTGRIMFDGNIQVRLLGSGELKTLRTDLAGMKLHKADQNKELLVLTNRFTDYNEIHTGYIVRTKQYDDQERPCFGLKHEPDADSWTIINYCDVIAWGYADGGLNDPTLFYSCQSTVEEEIDRERRRAEKGMKTHAERLAEVEAESEEEQQPGLTMKFKHDGDQVKSSASWPRHDPALVVDMPERMGTCGEEFVKFTEAHPEIKEMHFYTEPTEWEEDNEEVGE
jgi:hypothetical protein